MKFSVVLALVAAATIVSAESNAGRFARGLGPMSPMRRSSRPDTAYHSQPSNQPSKCSSGQTAQCCNTVAKKSDCDQGLLADLGLLDLDPDTLLGINCFGVLGNECTAQTTCCENDSFSGIVAVGCNNINL